VQVGFDPVSVRFRSDSELWVVNHISDSISIVDVVTRRVKASIATADEPFDVVFANGKAFVSCSQANRIQVFDVAQPQLPPISIAIAGEDPRALAVSPDQRFVYAAIFESGNATTVLSGGLAMREAGIPNVVSHASGPYGGQNPPPNAGSTFNPPMHANAPAAPPVGLIVRKHADQRWRDVNQRDWTAWVSGPQASLSGRRSGWDLLDHDIAVIDTQSLSVRYESGLMTMAMALAVNPATRTLHLVGTEALNEIRFEPNLNGRFLRTQIASLPLVRNADAPATRIQDLNPHLNYSGPRVPEAMRKLSSADPRGMIWQQDGQRGFVSGMGSNNVIVISPQGERLATIPVGEGPTGLALNEAQQRLYVWNHFSVTLSVIDTATLREIDRKIVFNPLPRGVRAGRQYLYDSHKTSGTGHLACASCHVDARMDKLAWDLGDPSKMPAAFDQLCATSLVRRCEDFHAMKGPMATQTMQDIIGHEPHHWRGDRTGIRAFNPTYEELLGDDERLEEADMQQLSSFLSSVRFPPNPFRNFDNSLPDRLELPGQTTSGRFAMAGLALPAGNAKRGLDLYTKNLLDSPFQCSSCHTLPTGMGVNGPVFLGQVDFAVGMSSLPLGPHGENRLGIVSTDGSSNVSMKTPQLRNMYEKVGFDMSQSQNTAGFGFLHDGSVDSLAKFLSASVFSPGSDQDVADLVALMMAFSGSDFGNAQPPTSAPAPLSKDAHAALGQQLSVQSAVLPARGAQMLSIAAQGKLDLIVLSPSERYRYSPSTQQFVAERSASALSETDLLARAATSPQTWMLLPVGQSNRFALDRDGDGVSDSLEVLQGSNPADAFSKTKRPRVGMWFNPERSGHGFDLQFAGEFMFINWFTYEQNGTPIWYQAAARYDASADWQADLNVFRWDPAAKRASASLAGQVKLAVLDAKRLRFSWTVTGLGSGVENMQPLLDGAPANPNITGAYYNPAESGWGITVEADGEVRIAVAFFYDANNDPRWSLGQSNHRERSISIAMRSYLGFCPSCNAVPTSNSDGGALQIDLSADNSLRVAADLRSPTTPNQRWQTNAASFQLLSTAELRPEDY
jgi:YVTN family beta-propeller protein